MSDIRPKYETKSSREAEEDLAHRTLDPYGMKAIRIHELKHRIDMCIKPKATDTIIAWVECKCLNRSYNTKPYNMLSLHKWFHGIQHALFTGLPWYFLISIKEGDYIYTYTQGDKFPIVYGGRTLNTRDSHDVEPVIHIPMKRFIPTAEAFSKDEPK